MLKSNLKQFFLFFLFLIYFTTPVKADDFPTIDRVLYVNECVRQHGGGTR